jgi:hypothetical protein
MENNNFLINFNKKLLFIKMERKYNDIKKLRKKFKLNNLYNVNLIDEYIFNDYFLKESNKYLKLNIFKNKIYSFTEMQLNFILRRNRYFYFLKNFKLNKFFRLIKYKNNKYVRIYKNYIKFIKYPELKKYFNNINYKWNIKNLLLNYNLKYKNVLTHLYIVKYILKTKRYKNKLLRYLKSALNFKYLNYYKYIRYKKFKLDKYNIKKCYIKYNLAYYKYKYLKYINIKDIFLKYKINKLKNLYLKKYKLYLYLKKNKYNKKYYNKINYNEYSLFEKRKFKFKKRILYIKNYNI